MKRIQTRCLDWDIDWIVALTRFSLPWRSLIIINPIQTSELSMGFQGFLN